MNAIDIFKLKLNEKIMEMVKKRKNSFFMVHAQFQFFSTQACKKGSKLTLIIATFCT